MSNLIYRITKKDQILFKNALKRFLEDVKVVEEVSGERKRKEKREKEREKEKREREREREREKRKRKRKGKEREKKKENFIAFFIFFFLGKKIFCRWDKVKELEEEVIIFCSCLFSSFFL